MHLDYLNFGRLLSVVGCTILAVVFCLGMLMTSVPILNWGMAMLALLFSFNGFTVAMAIAMDSPAALNYEYFIILNGTLTFSVAIMATGALWNQWRKA